MESHLIEVIAIPVGAFVIITLILGCVWFRYCTARDEGRIIPNLG